ncbi:MAG: tolB protein precursor protein [Myxococcota bacterium]
MTRPLIAGVVLWGLCSEAYAQVWVAPRRPGQSIVRNTDQEWKTLELLVDAEIDGHKAGGVRLFYYASEEETARRAAAQIEDAYRMLAEKFDFVPNKRFDYVLYATYQEFLRTNLFPTQEGVLGITATQGLHMAVPYFGDHQTFLHTSTHELAHEFMLQKVRAAAKETDTWRDPLDAMPLWFVEGLAEYMSTGPIDGENALRVRDLVTYPDLYTGHGLLSFWDDWPGYTLWTYQAGHARITFLEEVYGAGTVVELMALSPAMVSDQGLAARIQRFDRLLQEITGDEPERIAERFDDWIKRRTFQEWLDSDQTLGDIELLEQVVGVPLALDASPDGNLVAYRSIAPDTGRSALYVTDWRAPGTTRRIAADGRPGVESLHPIDPRNFDVDQERIAYVAEARGRDRLVVQALDYEATEEKGVAPGEPEIGDGEIDLPLKPPENPKYWRVKLKKGARRIVHLDDVHVVAANSVALEPGGERVAFVGLTTEGSRDLFLADPRTDTVVQLTRDVYAERDVAWGKDGLVFASDASADGDLQLFRLDPDHPEVVVRLTDGDGDHLSPTVLEDGTVVYTGQHGDRADLFATYEGETVRLTDLPTGAYEPATGPDDALWSLVLARGQLRPALIDAKNQRAITADGPRGAMGPDVRLPTRELDGSSAYRPLDVRNWGIDGGFAALGAGPGGVYGQLYLSFSDRLRDHAMLVVAEAYGTPELTDAQILYLDQRARLTWGAGPFHSLRFRLDQTVPDSPFLFQSGERFYGAMGSLRYPLNRFVYAQADASVGGVSYFLFDDTATLLADGELNGTGIDLLSRWEDANPSPRFQTEGALRLGVDTTRYHPKTGPVAGTSVLLEGTLGVQPLDDQLFASARIDAQQYFPIPLVSGGNLGLRASAATSGGGQYAIGYWLSSYDTLRAYNWGDPALLGRHYWFTNAEVQVPLDVLVRLAVASGIEGVAGLDFGGVSDDLNLLWDERVLDGALGTNFILGPLVLRLHFARAIDVGATLPETPTPWVTNFSISWLSF